MQAAGTLNLSAGSVRDSRGQHARRPGRARAHRWQRDLRGDAGLQQRGHDFERQLDFNADQSFVNLSQQTSGTLRGTGTVTVTGALNWTGGAMLDAGKTRIAASATGTISGGNVKDLAVNRVLENAGTLMVSGGTVFFNQSSFGGGAVINNLAGATLEAQGEVDFTHNLPVPIRRSTTRASSARPAAGRRFSAAPPWRSTTRAPSRSSTAH